MKDTPDLLIDENLWLWVRVGNGIFEKGHKGRRGRSKVIIEARLRDPWGCKPRLGVV